MTTVAQPQQPGQTEGVTQAAEAPVAALQDRFIEQNRQADRWMRHPDRADARAAHGARGAPVPTLWTDKKTGTQRVYGEGDGPNIGGAQHQEPHEPGVEHHVPGVGWVDPAVWDRWQNPTLWMGKNNGNLPDEAIRASKDLAAGNVTAQQLFRSYKSTPHQPASLFLKYIVHRVNHADQYDDPQAAHKLDQDFLSLQQHEGAQSRNGHVSVEDLHGWLTRNHRVIPEVLAHRDAVQQDILKGVGLNTRIIGGVPHVALTRGLKSDIMTKEHALSSWADVPDTGFGSNMHHAWVPLKDVWMGYPHFHSDYSEGNHENEYLVSHTAPKYEAAPHDIKESRLKDWKWWNAIQSSNPYGEGRENPYDLGIRARRMHPWTDQAQDGDIAQHLAGTRTGALPNPHFLKHKNAGPATQAAVAKLRSEYQGPAGSNAPNAAIWYSFSSTPREHALSALQDKMLWTGTARTPLHALENPNLTHDDLAAVVSALPPENGSNVRIDAAKRLLAHPAADSTTAEHLWNTTKAQPTPDGATFALASSRLTPPHIIEDLVDRVSKDKGDAAGWGEVVSHLSDNPNLTEEQTRKLAGWLQDAKFGLSRLAMSAPLPKDVIEKLVEEANSRDFHTETEARGALNAYVEHNPRASEAGLLASFGAASPRAKPGWGSLSEYDGPLDTMYRRSEKLPLPPAVQTEYIRLLNDAYRSGEEARELGDAPSRFSQYLRDYAKDTHLTPESIAVLAGHPDPDVRDYLYRNPTVTPEALEAGFPKGQLGQEARKLVEEGYKPSNPIEEWWAAIRDRKAYAARKAQEHLIKPLPAGLWKAEDSAEQAMWRATVADWLSKLQTHDPGWLVVMDTEAAHQAMRSLNIDPDWTTELLEGQAVIASPAKVHHYVNLQVVLPAGQVILQFHTDDKPKPMTAGRFYWDGPVKLRDARVLAIGQQMGKAEEPLDLDELAKMAIAGLRAGRKLKAPDATTRATRFNYSHLLTPEQRRAGYGLVVHEKPADWGETGAHVVRAGVTHTSAQQRGNLLPGEVGYSTGHIAPSTAEAPGFGPRYGRVEGKKYLHVGNSEILDPQHLHRGLGVAMYEALYTHAMKRHGVGVVSSLNENHSSSSHRVHEALARKHGLAYDAGPAVPNMFSDPEKNQRVWEQKPNGPYDEKWGPYEYAIKSEEPLDLGVNLLPRKLEDWEHEMALRMLGHDPDANRALAAARFLTGHKREPDMERYRLAFRVFGDVERAALYAYQVPDSQKNVRALRATLKLGGKDLKKAEAEMRGPEPHETISNVQPGVAEAKDTAAEVWRAIQAGMVTSLHLSGKHSKGAMAVKDPNTHYVWLLKPGSGSFSPAAGVKQEKGSQSRREAASWHIAYLFGLSNTVPHADLIVVNDGEEWAAIKLLGPEFKPLDEKNKKVESYAAGVLQPYLDKGILHRWAAFLWVIGETDAHGQNVLVNPGGSVALIDHGSAFAGTEFDPGHDKDSFIPYILRAWGPVAFMKLAPEDRLRYMPRLSRERDGELREWLESIEPAEVEAMTKHYGLDPKPVMTRLHALRSVDGNLSEAVNRLWAGA